MKENRLARLRQEKRDFFIDPQYESYQGFFDHQWAEDNMYRLDDYPELDLVFYDLCFDWKCVSNSFRFPWLLPEISNKFVQGFLEVDEPDIIQFSKILKQRITDRVSSEEGLVFLKGLQDEIQHAIFDLTTVRKKMVDEHISEKMWQRYKSESEFAFAIWGLMKQSYTSLVFSYEHFL